MRRLLLALLVLAAVALGATALAWRQATRDPVVRRAGVSLARWPAGAPPVAVALVSDLHVGNAATDAARVARIADVVNAEHPDLVVLAGDFVAGHESADAAAAPALVPGLARLRAPLGVVAVLGNHDHWTSAAKVRAALAQAGVTVLANAAVRRGPLAVGGLDDMVTAHANLPATERAMAQVGGAPILVSHSPDIAPRVARGLVLAGHTHCGQIVLPLVGPPAEVSHYGARYRCGLVRERGRTTIVTAGTGTSVLPLRWRAPPDVWLVRVGRQGPDP